MPSRPTPQLGQLGSQIFAGGRGRGRFAVEFRVVERGAGAFQEGVAEEQVVAMCRRAFGDRVQPVSVTEFGLGSYNSTYRVDLAADGPVILRVAPEPARQSRAERSLMRNEHASIPYLAPIAALMPRTLMVDFTHEVIGRDYLFQTVLDGVVAPDRLPDYPRPEWAPFFAQLGALSRCIHDVRGESFGWWPGLGTPAGARRSLARSRTSRPRMTAPDWMRVTFGRPLP